MQTTHNPDEQSSVGIGSAGKIGSEKDSSEKDSSEKTYSQKYSSEKIDSEKISAEKGRSFTRGSLRGDRPQPNPPKNGPLQNRILAALTKPEIDRLTVRMQLVELKLGEAIYQPGQRMQYAYFPSTSIISLQYVTESGASAEAASVGNEGMVGVQLFLGGNTTSNSAVVQMAGYAYRLDAAILKAEFNCAGVMQRLLLRYVQVLMTQMFQTAVCNRHHSVEQQLGRWLLLTVDRIATTELVMTQELVANMLGVRRESITLAASNLQSENCIRYRRGHIAVIDRKKLESRVCECYEVVKKELNRLMTS